MRKPAPSTAFDGTAGNLFAGSLRELLLGNVASYDEFATKNPVLTRWRNQGIYVQDNFKAASNLTLNLGLRWQKIGQPYSAIDNVANFFPNLFDPAQAPTLDQFGNAIQGTGNPTNGLITAEDRGDLNRSLVEDHLNDWEPRIGFAYDPFRKGKFVLRGGFGIYHAQESVDHLVNIGQNVPFNQQAFIFGTTFSDLGGIQPGTPQPIPGLTALDRDRFNPTSFQYSFGIQVAPFSNSTLEVNYVGSQAIHLGRNRDINQVPPSAQPAVAAGASPIPFRPFVGYNNITLNERAGVARYNSLQVFFNQRMSHGLQLQAAYTLSHSISNSPNEQNGAGAQPIQDAFNPELDRGWSNIDQPQAFIINYIWEIPSFKDHGGWAEQVLGGWQVAGINTFASGQPTSACLLGDNAGIGSFSGLCQRADAVGPIRLDSGERALDRFFNTDGFALPTSGTFGNAAKNNIRLPGVNNWDLSIFKNFRTPWFAGNLFSEEARIQFRAEFFNVWNHTQYSGLGTTFGTPSFGRVVSVRPPREIQFGLKFLW